MHICIVPYGTLGRTEIGSTAHVRRPVREGEARYYIGPTTPAESNQIQKLTRSVWAGSCFSHHPLTRWPHHIPFPSSPLFPTTAHPNPPRFPVSPPPNPKPCSPHRHGARRHRPARTMPATAFAPASASPPPWSPRPPPRRSPARVRLPPPRSGRSGGGGGGDEPTTATPWVSPDWLTSLSRAVGRGGADDSGIPVASAKLDDVQDLLGGALFLPLFKWFREEGPVYRLAAGPRDFVIVSDPAVAKHVLRGYGSRYEKGLVAEVSEFLFGSGFATAEGALWTVSSFARSQLTAQFVVGFPLLFGVC